jgi:hypothetical protein
MSKVVRLHRPDAMKLPLAGGASLELTPFRDSPHVALSLIGPAGGDGGGVILRAERARRLGSWLLRLADRCEGTAVPEPAGGSGGGDDGGPIPLDEESIMALARAAVPVFADWCVIDVVEADGSMRRLAPAYSDPLRARLAEKLQLYPHDRKALHPRSEALRVGTPYVHPQVAESSILALAQNREHLQLMRNLGPRSTLGMPIVVRERVLGVMTFVWTDPNHCYDDADVPLARALADQVGVALDNVQLYRAARVRFAGELKESIRRRRRPIGPVGSREG